MNKKLGIFRRAARVCESVCVCVTERVCRLTAARCHAPLSSASLRPPMKQVVCMHVCVCVHAQVCVLVCMWLCTAW